MLGVGISTCSPPFLSLSVPFPLRSHFSYFVQVTQFSQNDSCNSAHLQTFTAAHNLGSETKKATGIPMYMAIGQCGSVLGSHIYPATEGPRYMYVLLSALFYLMSCNVIMCFPAKVSLYLALWNFWQLSVG